MRKIQNNAHYNNTMNDRMAQSAVPENPSIVTEELLKRESGEFTLESIFILDFSSRGLCSLGCIVKCLNLRVLDLSSNHLSAIGELAVLSALEHLDLSDNNISQLDGLHKLENLSRLELAGNELCSFGTFIPLSSLYKLERLTLQISQSSSSQCHTKLSNPLCRQQNYATTMLDIFPTLIWLDREMVKAEGLGRTFYSECRDIQNSNGQCTKERHDAKELPVMVDPLQAADFGELSCDSEEKIKELLVECRDSSNKVQKFLSDVRSELNLSSSLATEH